jgi:hypothetical protein
MLYVVIGAASYLCGVSTVVIAAWWQLHDPVPPSRIAS